MAMSPPLITYYARVISNLNPEKEILPFTNVITNNTWYYGKCNLYGGESEYIVEFDIWNNEPAFDAGTRRVPCKDAKNCKFTVYSKYDETRRDNPFIVNSNDLIGQKCLYARNLNNYIQQEDFKPINGKLLNGSIDVRGNVNPNEIGVLSGEGDHTIIQTKIIVPSDAEIQIERVNFVFQLSYDYEE
ncbi:MAG: hypothetical protein ACOCRK_01405 [bacterium]